MTDAAEKEVVRLFMKIVAFEPIKLNSQRLPEKNKLLLAGRPLCYHLTNTLLQVSEIDEVYVFCSSDEVRDYVPAGTRFLKRDGYYDGDGVKSLELIGKFIDCVDADIYVFANTTSPFLKADSVSNAIRHVMDGGYDSAVTVREFKTFALYRGKPLNYNSNDIPKTQEIEPVYVETSGAYIFKKEIFTKHHRRLGFHPYMQIVDEIEGVDIDTREDFDYAQILAGLAVSSRRPDEIR